MGEEQREKKMVIIAQRNGKTGEWGFFSMFPYYFLPEHIPGIFFKTGMIGGENGEVDGQLQYSGMVVVGSYR